MNIPGLPPEWAILLAFAACVGTLLVGFLKSKALDRRVIRLEKTNIHFATKAEVDKLCNGISKLNGESREHDKDSVHLEEIMRFMESARERLDACESLRAEFLEKFTLRGDYIREMQIINSQLYNIHQKMNQVDNWNNPWKGRPSDGNS